MQNCYIEPTNGGATGNCDLSNLGTHHKEGICQVSQFNKLLSKTQMSYGKWARSRQDAGDYQAVVRWLKLGMSPRVDNILEELLKCEDKQQ